MLNLSEAVVYDIETFPNVFTLTARGLFNDFSATWEISDFRDDRQYLMQWFNWLNQNQTPMIGFNNINFDYPIIHYIFNNPNVTAKQIHEKAMSIINSRDNFGHLIWADNRFTPQIDVFKIQHFDNPAKSTSLKALQINMRSPSVVDMPVEVGSTLTKEEINNLLIPYNDHDVINTKDFALLIMTAIQFRISLISQFGIDVMNWPDTKIGSKMMENKIGTELCYDFSTGYKKARQTPRTKIVLKDIIFSYISFQNPEFQRILNYLKNQTLEAEEVKSLGQETTHKIKTKGVFTDLKATIDDIEFHFGTGGIHGSISTKKVEATEDWLIRDIDVASLYPSIAIVNKLAPEHLGQRFVEIYSQLPQERKKWQNEKGKKCVEANSLKLASNGVYGNSNNQYSVFYDPKFTITITINGQLLLCMLAEKLLTVPTLKIIQINTDGITYYIHKNNEPIAKKICQEWEKLTNLVLEDINYSRMWIRDVNNYIAEDSEKNLKLKGAYWTPDPLDYDNSISNAQPPAWHKDLSNLVSIRAAVAYMIHGLDPEIFIRLTTNPYDFMCRVKVKRSDRLLWGNQEVQRNTRYFISNEGELLIKQSPPVGRVGMFKKASGISDNEYQKIMNETNGEWDSRVCTKNKSKYENRLTMIQAGYNTIICNDVKDFDFSKVNYDWYINEAKKLIIT